MSYSEGVRRLTQYLQDNNIVRGNIQSPYIAFSPPHASRPNYYTDFDPAVSPVVGLQAMFDVVNCFLPGIQGISKTSRILEDMFDLTGLKLSEESIIRADLLSLGNVCSGLLSNVPLGFTGDQLLLRFRTMKNGFERETKSNCNEYNFLVQPSDNNMYKFTPIRFK